MKKVIVILFLLQLFSIKSFAGDTDEYFAYNDKSKLFTATIESVTNQDVEVKVICKIKGDVTGNEILKLPFFEYNSKDKRPKVGESCFIAFVEGEEFYSIKTTSTDPKTLKFINNLTNASMDMLGMSVYERIERNVNEGRYEDAERRRISKMSVVRTNLESGVGAPKNQKNTTLGIFCIMLGMFVIAMGVFVLKRKARKA